MSISKENAGKKKLHFTEGTGDQRKHLLVLYVVLLILYGAASVYTRIVSQSTGGLELFGNYIPFSAFPGVFTTVANMCVILMVIFLNKLGFYTAMVLLICQFPMMLFGFIKSHNVSALPGLFTNLLTIMVVIIIHRRNDKIEEFRKHEIDNLVEQQKGSKRLFRQTITALVSAIDAKDEYSRGHSIRVAEYSRKIAQEMGKSESECDRIYYTALLHDVGKIGVADAILTKNGKLTQEEYEKIKEHSAIGSQILSGITEYPWLKVGAEAHHERYDGKGYPNNLKGEYIPEIARIISVADSYDAMTSNRSYRDALPQQVVREEILKGAGTQFDPEIAKVMQHLIDIDYDYQMKEEENAAEQEVSNTLQCTAFRAEVTKGVRVSSCPTTVRLKVLSEEADAGLPSLILFDSIDGCVHTDERSVRSLDYYEYAVLRFDGEASTVEAREIRTEIKEKSPQSAASTETGSERTYEIEAVRFGDHVRIRISDVSRTLQATVALVDNTRFSYIALTGEKCTIQDIEITRSEKEIGAEEIARIAPEISYIDGPEGDVPNLQIEGFRAAATKGIPLKNGMTLRFHTKSLPSARLIWHCPYIDIFSSRDGQVYGEDYREYALIRLDGESWEADRVARNHLIVNRLETFEGWDVWKQKNKEGFDCEVTFQYKGNMIDVITVNHGLSIHNITLIGATADENDGSESWIRTDGMIEEHGKAVDRTVYVSLTGDQCALTDIRIESGTGTGTTKNNENLYTF